MVVEGFALHGANHAKVVGMLRDVREKIREFHAALAMLAKLARASEHGSSRLDEGQFQVLGQRGWKRFAMPLIQLGLGIEQVHLAGRALHKQEDHVLRLWREVGLLRRQRIGRLRGDVGVQQIRQRDGTQPCRSVAQE